MAIYAGAGKSALFIDGERKSVQREEIKKAVKERRIRLVVATDPACEGLILQTLGTLIDVDLPWNPSHLEQRIGRIKRFGQRRDKVDMLNLVYHGAIDEKVYKTLSSRMQDRYNIFGTLPDVIEDDWIEDIEDLGEELREFTTKKHQANTFDLRYAEGLSSAFLLLPLVLALQASSRVHGNAEGNARPVACPCGAREAPGGHAASAHRIRFAPLADDLRDLPRRSGAASARTGRRARR